MAPPEGLFLQKLQTSYLAWITTDERPQTGKGNHSNIHVTTESAYRELVHVVCLSAKAGHHAHIACLHQASTSEILADVCRRLFLLLCLCFVLHIFSLCTRRGIDVLV